VQRAPAIAEEILAKTASLPESLRSFTKSLLTKESSKDEGDRLELPKRMTLGELSKIAHENKVDLPKIQGVKSDDYAKVASELIAIAKREEQKEANDVFESAAAIVAANHEKQAARGAAAAKMLGGAGRGPLSVAKPQLHGLLDRMALFPGYTQRRAEHELGKAVQARDVAKIQATTPHPADPLAEIEKHKTEKRHEFAEKALGVAPMMGLAVGTPLAAAALLAKDRGGKKEEVKIYK
jgi:hypothetical protein